MARVFNRERTFLDPVLRPIERLFYRLTGWTKTMKCDGRNIAARCFFSAAFPWRFCTASSDSSTGCHGIRRNSLPSKRPCVQHCRILSDEHELAELFRRNHHELSHPDGGFGLSQFWLGGGWYRPGDSVRSRHSASRKRDHRKFLGRHHSNQPVGIAAELHRLRPDSGVSGRRTEFETL